MKLSKIKKIIGILPIKNQITLIQNAVPLAQSVPDVLEIATYLLALGLKESSIELLSKKIDDRKILPSLNDHDVCLYLALKVHLGIINKPSDVNDCFCTIPDEWPMKWFANWMTTGSIETCEASPAEANPFLLDNSYKAVWNDTCSSCSNTSIYSLDSGFISTDSRTIRWICPHCLAKRAWDKEKARIFLWNFFSNWINTQMDEQKGVLSSDKINEGIGIADSIHTIAPIRFGRLPTEAIGHLALNSSIYLAYKSLGLTGESLDYVGIDYDIFMSNSYLVEKLTTVFDFHPIAPQFLKYNLPSYMEIPELSIKHPELYTDPFGQLNRSIPPFSFSLKERLQASRELEAIGVPRGAKFICLHLRDEAYEADIRKMYKPIHTRYRFTSQDNYKLAAEYLVELGYYIIRTGKKVQTPLSWSSDRIIDYASNYDSEFLDIWLFCNCDLCISTGSGPDVLSRIFHRNLLYTDWIGPVVPQNAYETGALFLPKKYYYKDGRRVTIKEARHHKLYTKLSFDDLGIYVECNSPDEILLAVKEKLSIMNGEWIPSPLVEELQDRYAQIAMMASYYSCDILKEKIKSRNSYRQYARPDRIVSHYLLADYEQELANSRSKHKD
ncbi:TIGR04372 family glycosyltransferase [Desulfovibrio sp. TomC]|uniref:TIGR04372 family glycosyltransferase n=1 Tax=Desulfovibrio sp. TomC TaxID=1562888 RepID=UPI000573298D|nr:TIGR04372 family glycosyltransferase [Desulfovibrio sp. TomC]KHK00280.1 hypothetical protein NY78_4292 [Desulfovibrio sp. TomC]